MQKTKKLFLIYLFSNTLFFSGVIYSGDYSTAEILIDKVQKTAEDMLTPPNGCESGKGLLSTDDQALCASLTDNFCEELWSKTNSGNMSVGDSKFLLGKSKRSDISMRSFLDINALLESESRLPSRLQKALKGPLEALREVMKNEKDSKKWYRNFKRAYGDVNFAIEDAAEEFTKSKHPELKNKKYRDQTVEETSFYVEDFQDCNNDRSFQNIIKKLNRRCRQYILDSK